MMGVYIRGMEMPTKCTGCPFVRDIGDYTFVGCKLNVGFAINRAFPYRHTYCPLVPVPPHGRLIDADALLAEHYECDANPGWIKSAAIITPQLVSNLPTIIPAEREGE